jgi:hypothetical protein
MGSKREPDSGEPITGEQADRSGGTASRRRVLAAGVTHADSDASPIMSINVNFNRSNASSFCKPN